MIFVCWKTNQKIDFNNSNGKRSEKRRRKRMRKLEETASPSSGHKSDGLLPHLDQIAGHFSWERGVVNPVPRCRVISSSIVIHPCHIFSQSFLFPSNSFLFMCSRTFCIVNAVQTIFFAQKFISKKKFILKREILFFKKYFLREKIFFI